MLLQPGASSTMGFPMFNMDPSAMYAYGVMGGPAHGMQALPMQFAQQMPMPPQAPWPPQAPPSMFSGGNGSAMMPNPALMSADGRGYWAVASDGGGHGFPQYRLPFGQQQQQAASPSAAAAAAASNGAGGGAAALLDMYGGRFSGGNVGVLAAAAGAAAAAGDGSQQSVPRENGAGAVGIVTTGAWSVVAPAVAPAAATAADMPPPVSLSVASLPLASTAEQSTTPPSSLAVGDSNDDDTGNGKACNADAEVPVGSTAVSAAVTPAPAPPLVRPTACQLCTRVLPAVPSRELTHSLLVDAASWLPYCESELDTACELRCPGDGASVCADAAVPIDVRHAGCRDAFCKRFYTRRSQLPADMHCCWSSGAVRHVLTSVASGATDVGVCGPCSTSLHALLRMLRGYVRRHRRCRV